MEQSKDLQVKKKEITMKVAGYLMNLPKEQVVKLLLTNPYDIKDVIKEATGNSSNWTYVDESVMDSRVEV